MIFATPTDIAVTVPSAATFAIDSLSEDHVIVLSVVLAGSIVAVSLSDCPISNVMFDALSLTPEATIGLTVTLQVAETSPQVAVIVATPTETAVTVPSALTLAIASLSEVHVTVLSVVLAGSTVAVSLSV